MARLYLIKLSPDGINWTINDALLDANQLTFLVNHCANMWVKVVTQ